MSTAPAQQPRLFSFVGGGSGKWLVRSNTSWIGEALPSIQRIDVRAGSHPRDGTQATWVLSGVTSNDRYVERPEKSALQAKQEGLGRPGSVHAALIPIRKTAAWWALTQEERRDVFEAQSHHIGIGMKYLPAIARRLHHCRDLGSPEPFDFITWFEYAPEQEPAFEALLHALRSSPEWAYVDREVDLRLSLAAS